MKITGTVWFVVAILSLQKQAHANVLSKEDAKGWEEEARDLENSLNIAIGDYHKRTLSEEEDDHSGKPCRVSLITKAKGSCFESRKKLLQERRKFYLFTNPEKTKQVYPFSNITAPDIVKATMMDPDLARWLRLNKVLVENTAKLLGMWKEGNQSKEIRTFDQFTKIYDFFISKGPTGDEYKYPWIGDENFIDIVHNERWRDDRFFTDQVFAGGNPMAIQKVSLYGKRGLKWSDLKKKLNPNFDWNGAVSDVIGKKMSIKMAVRRGLVYVLRYPLLDDAITMPDITNDKPTRHMLNTSSPIALFAVSRDDPVYSSSGMKGADVDDENNDSADDDSEENGHSRQFKMYPVAIQMDHKNDSSVYTPASGDQWSLAKANLHMIDGLDSVLFQHVVKAHIVMETICLSVYRHFPEDHPLFQILKHHCGPVLTLGVLTIRSISKDGGTVHITTPIGSQGAGNLMNDGYNSITWKELGFFYDIKKRGLSDRKKVPYYPYRDDGSLIVTAINHFTRSYISMYYGKKDVKDDSELQAFANEVSADGQGFEGEKGQLKGFPARINTRRQLISVISQIIWLASGRHAAMNYPTSLYFAFTPNIPTKLYNDDRTPNNVFSAFRLPQENVVLAQIALGLNVGTMRYDSLLDYGPRLRQKRARKLVQAYKMWLNRHPTNIIMARNKRRYKTGHLSYPYLLPSLITNSVAS